MHFSYGTLNSVLLVWICWSFMLSRLYRIGGIFSNPFEFCTLNKFFFDFNNIGIEVQ